MSVTNETIGGGASPNPGLVWIGNEEHPPKPDHYFEDRETLGVLYRVQNAKFDGTNWTVQDSSASPSAFALNADGSIIYLAPNSTGSTFTGWVVTGKHGVYDVRDFGAVGDDSHDDAAAINAAATAASNAGGGTVYLPPGNYMIKTGILLGDNTQLVGDLSGPTIITAADNMQTPSGTYSNIMVANVNYNITDPGGTWQKNIAVKNITFNNNAIGNANARNVDSAINFRGVFDVTIENCTVYNCGNHAISVVRSYAPSNAVAGSVRILNNTIDVLPVRTGGLLTSGNLCIRIEALNNVLIQGNVIGYNPPSSWVQTWSNDGIDTPGCSYVTISNNMIRWATDGIGTEESANYCITNNIIESCIGYGIRSFQGADGTSSSNNLVICNNIIIGVPAGALLGPTQDGIHVDTGVTLVAQDCTISSNVLLGPFENSAISLASTQGTCNNNLIDLQNAACNGIGIKADNWTVVGNTVRNGAATGSIGIVIPVVSGFPGPRVNLVIAENNIYGCATGLMINSGNPTNSRISNNIGFNPPPPATISQPSITTLQTNTTPFDCTVYIKPDSSGTHNVSKIEVNGLAILSSAALVTPISVRVPVNGTIKVTYTGSPTWVWIPE